MRGGRREGAGRKPAPEHLKKVPFNTKLPRWLRDWLADPMRGTSATSLVERALCETYQLSRPAPSEPNTERQP